MLREIEEWSLHKPDSESWICRGWVATLHPQLRISEDDFFDKWEYFVPISLYIAARYNWQKAITFLHLERCNSTLIVNPIAWSSDSISYRLSTCPSISIYDTQVWFRWEKFEDRCGLISRFVNDIRKEESRWKGKSRSYSVTKWISMRNGMSLNLAGSQSPSETSERAVREREKRDARKEIPWSLEGIWWNLRRVKRFNEGWACFVEPKWRWSRLIHENSV